MKKNRMTRLSFKRKAVMFGAVVLASLALITTGFAVWVMSTDTKKDVSGNVSVGTVEGGKLSFSDVAITSEATGFYFEPQETDKEGIVKHKEGALSESLEITVSGKISPLEELGKLYYRVQVPEGVKAAADAGYIVLPEAATVKADATSEEPAFVQGKALSFSGSTGTHEFSFDVEFAWGDKFGGVNPGLYYDSPEAEGISYAEIKKTLEDFRAILYGYLDELEAIETNPEYTTPEAKAAARVEVIESHEQDVGPKFTVIVYAESKL